MFNGLGMAFLGRFGEASALMDADRDVRPCGLLQKVQFADDASVMEVRQHVWTVGILVQE